MKRQEILNQARELMGSVPGWLDSMPDTVLDQYWNSITWVLSDSKLSAREKALVAFGAASAVHCQY